MPPENHTITNPEENPIDLLKWLGKILSVWYWFVISILVFGSSAYFYTKYQEPIYEVESTILIKDNNKALGAEVLFNYFDFGSSGYLENEIQRLKSWSLARRTLGMLNFEISYYAVGRLFTKHLHLYDNIPFRVTLGPDPKSLEGLPIHVTLLTDSTFQLRVNEGHNINTVHQFNVPFVRENFNFIISKNPNFALSSMPEFMQKDEYYFSINDLNKLAYTYKNKIQADWVNEETSVIRIASTGHSIQKEVDYLNSLMREYIKLGLEEKNETATNTVEFIDDLLSGIVDSLRLAEENLSDFRSENRVINLTSEGQAIFEKMDQLTQERALIDMQVNYYEYLLDYLKHSKDFSDVMAPSTMGINDQMLTSLITKLVELSSRKASLEYSATENFQALSMVNLEIQANQEALMENVRNILNTAKLNQQGVIRRTNQLNTEITKLPETERQFLNIQRRFNMADEIYTFLSQKRAEAAIAEASNVADQVVVDWARVDAAKKIAPKNKMNYAIGLLLGLLIPFVVIVLKDFLNTKIREKEDVENQTTIPVIGTVGHNKTEAVLPATEFSRSSIAESFRAIRTDLQFLLFKQKSKVIMVTSTTGGEGKSFISLNLGGIFSVTNKKTVLVGLDLRKPVIHKHVDLDNKNGVSTFIVGKCKIEDIIHPSDQKYLSYIPSGPIPPNPAELFETEEFVEFIEELKSRFEVILFDTPPVALVTDASLIAKYCDATLYIVRQDYTSKTALSFIDKFAGKQHVKNLNIVINDVVVPKYYGYKYGYGYGYGYGKGYGSGYYTDEK